MKLILWLLLGFSFSTFASIEISTPSSNIDISSSAQDVEFVLTSNSGGETLYRSIRIPDGTSVVSNTCQMNQVLALSESCSIIVNVPSSLSSAQGTLTVKYMEVGGARKNVSKKIDYIKDAGASLSVVFGTNSSGEVEFNSLNILQSSKRIVKIANLGNIATPVLANVSSGFFSKSVDLIGDTCSGQVLNPKDVCYFKLRVDSSKLFAGNYSSTLNISSQVDGQVLLSIPVVYDLSSDRVSSDAFGNINLAKNNVLDECLDNINILDKVDCFYSLSTGNVISNGNFNNSLNDWQQVTSTGGSISIVAGAAQISIGSSFGTNADLYQNFNTEEGREYIVSYKLLGVSGGAGTEGTFIVRDSQENVLFHKVHSPGESGDFSFSFIAADSISKLIVAPEVIYNSSITVDDIKIESTSSLASSAQLLYSDLDCFDGKCFYSMEYAMENAPLRIPVTLSFNDVNAQSIQSLNYIVSKKISAPYSQISNRALVEDDNLSGKALFGSERIQFAQIEQVPLESSPVGAVYEVNQDSRFRVYGSGVSYSSNLGGFISIPLNNSFEVTFYGTGLNVLSSPNTQVTWSIDGGLVSGVFFLVACHNW